MAAPANSGGRDVTRRYALYWLPAPGSRLDAFGKAVLGYDNVSGDTVAHPAAQEDLAAVTAGARVYGFHATLKAPLRLAEGTTETDLVAAARSLAAAHPPVAVGPLEVAAIGPFLALVPEAPPAALGLLAAECVAALDPFRAPLTEAERAKRRADRLGPRGRALLDRWGYPYVFEAFRFHMTLTDALPDAERDAWRARLTEAYAACGPEPLVIDALCLLSQDGSEPFRLLARLPFGDAQGASHGDVHG
jgi:putative phosphonate metabolism protein